MIGYKIFNRKKGMLLPWYFVAQRHFEAYPKNTVIMRADDCGPFAVFETARRAQDWCWSLNDGDSYCEDGEDILHKVRYKPSKDCYLWIGRERHMCSPYGTKFADEFEILEEVLPK